MHIFTYKNQKYFKLIKLIIKMRCRHQAITISSKAKKGILKDLLIDNHSNANDQDEYLTEYFLSKFPKSQINEEKKNEMNEVFSIPPPKVKHKKIFSTNTPFQISKKGKIVNFNPNDYTLLPEDKKVVLQMKELKEQINKEDSINDIQMDDLLNISTSDIQRCKEKLAYFAKKINSKNNPYNYNGLKRYFEKTVKEEQEVEQNIKNIIYNINNIDSIELNKEGNVYNFKQD